MKNLVFWVWDIGGIVLTRYVQRLNLCLDRYLT